MVGITTIEQDTYTTLRSLINANLPSYTYNGIEITYTLLSEFPYETPTFPLIIVNECKVSVKLLNLDGSGEEYTIEIQIDFYAKAIHGKKAISVGRDSLRNTFINNLSNFDIDNGLLPKDDFWDDSNVSVFEAGNELLNIGSVMIVFVRK